MESDWHYVPVAPVAKQRARLGRRRRAYTPEKTLNFESAVKEWWQKNGESYGSLPVFVSIEIEREGFWIQVCELEASHRPIGIRGDCDNYVKAICDGLNGAAWDDDKQIEWLEVKFIGDERKPK